MTPTTTDRPPRHPPVVWTIAGFDPSSGAGVTADLMTFAAHGLFGCSAITALTVQTTRGVFASEPVPPALLASTLERLDEDLPPRGIKIGMLGTPELAEVLASFLTRQRQDRHRRPIVVLDPVLRSTSGRALYPDAGLAILQHQLLPAVDWITPNWAELRALSGQPVADSREAERAARHLAAQYEELTVVATGGDQEPPADMVVMPGGTAELVTGAHIATTSTHGTGCAFSSALLAHLVAGAGPLAAVRGAKAFVEGALQHAPGVGGGRGPMDLLWPLRQARADLANLTG